MPWEFLGFRTCLFHERQEACFFMLNQKGYFFMLKLASTVAVLAVLSVAASAQTNVRVLTAVPMDSVTVSNWYKQSVYDPSDAKVGAGRGEADPVPESGAAAASNRKSLKRNRRRRRRRPHHRAASSRCTAQAARAGRATSPRQILRHPRAKG